MGKSPKDILEKKAKTVAKKLVTYVPPRIRSIKLPRVQPRSPTCGPAGCPPATCPPPGPCGPYRRP